MQNLTETDAVVNEKRISAVRPIDCPPRRWRSFKMRVMRRLALLLLFLVATW
jgi:hypothetical protein